MVAKLSYCNTEFGKLPSAVIAHSWSCYYEDNIDRLILAHKEDDGDVRMGEFVCEDEEQAWKELRRRVIELYPGCTIREVH